MAVDDTGGGGEQGGNATQRRFEPLCLSRREPLQIIDAVRPGRVGNAFKTRDFAFFSGYDRLANLDMRDSMIAAIEVKALAPRDAAACFSGCRPDNKARHESPRCCATRSRTRSYRRVQGQVHRAPPTREPAPSQARPPLHRSPRIRSRSRHPYPIGDRLRQLCTRAHGWCMNQFTHAVGSGSSKNRGLGLHRHR